MQCKLAGRTNDVNQTSALYQRWLISYAYRSGVMSASKGGE